VLLRLKKYQSYKIISNRKKIKMDSDLEGAVPHLPPIGYGPEAEARKSNGDEYYENETKSRATVVA